MSPLQQILMRAIRAGCVFAAGFLLAVIVLEIWTRWLGEGGTRQDATFMVVLVLLLAGAVWLARSISRELRKAEGSSPDLNGNP